MTIQERWPTLARFEREKGLRGFMMHKDPYTNNGDDHEKARERAGWNAHVDE